MSFKKKVYSLALKARHDFSRADLEKLGSVMIGEMRWAVAARMYAHQRYVLYATNDGWVSLIGPDTRCFLSDSKNTEIRGSNDKQPWAMVDYAEFKWVEDHSYLPVVDRSSDNTESEEMLALERRLMRTKAITEGPLYNLRFRKVTDKDLDPPTLVQGEVQGELRWFWCRLPAK